MTLEELQIKLVKFRDQRSWKQFHNPKDLSLSLVLEAGEVMEHFQWKDQKSIDKYLTQKNRLEIAEEMADVLIYLLYLADRLNVSLSKAVLNKIKKNEKRFPVALAKKTKHSK